MKSGILVLRNKRKPSHVARAYHNHLNNSHFHHPDAGNSFNLSPLCPESAASVKRGIEKRREGLLICHGNKAVTKLD